MHTTLKYVATILHHEHGHPQNYEFWIDDTGDFIIADDGQNIVFNVTEEN